MDDTTLRRREFLARTAAAAGLAGLGSLPAGTLLAEAARAQITGLPSPRNLPLDHFVVVMMENRSFDHYFGWLDGADGSQDETYPTPRGEPVGTRHASSLEAQWQGCGHPDPGHGWDGGPRAAAAAAIPRPTAAATTSSRSPTTTRASSSSSTPRPASTRSTTASSARCSGRRGPTATTSGRRSRAARKDNTPPARDGGQPVGDDLRPRARPERRLTARYYNSDLPFSAVWGARGVTWTRPLAEYYADCAPGTLPNITFVDPPFRDGGGGDGISADEHPHGDVRLGQAFMADVVHAFIESPSYERGALFIVYDEWGGFFDHVRPPRVPRRPRAAATSTRTSGRWASASRRSRSPRSRARGSVSATRSSASSRSSS